MTTKTPTNGTLKFLWAVVSTLLAVVFGTLLATSKVSEAALEARVDAITTALLVLQKSNSETNQEILQRLTAVETLMRKEYGIPQGTPLGGREEGP